MNFSWDANKARSNLAKHTVSFEEASTVFADSLSVSIPDPLHSDEEERFILLGLSLHGRLIVVVHTEQDDIVRIISARLATAHERKQYEQGT